jgi:hypothetical protein
LAGVTHVTAWRWLRLLERTRVLHRVRTGTLATKKANEFRYVGWGEA